MMPRPQDELRVLVTIENDCVRLQRQYPLTDTHLKQAVSQRLAASGVGREGDLDRLMAKINRRIKHG